MKFDLSKTEVPQDSKPLTTPGTVAVFDVADVKFDEKNDKEFFQVTFEREQDLFNEWFYMTTDASKRIVELFDRLNEGVQIPNDENAIIAALKGKKVALRVSGKVNPNNGKGGPTLPFLGFSRKPALIQELIDRGFSTRETEGINAALAAIKGGTNGTSETPPESTADPDSF